MEKSTQRDDLSCDNVDDVLILDDGDCASISAIENILGKFWGKHHEISYYLIRD